MEVLEQVWETLGDVFGGVGRAVERGLTSLFGSANARYLRRLQPKVEAINAREPYCQQLTDAELRAETDKFRKRLAAGETLDDLLIEAFAVCREAGRRRLGMRHFDVQLLGGMVLHSGAIAEMVTGEGKTLVATLPAYLNALEGKGVHVVTVNDYLARRDMEWMGPLYMALGLTVGAIQHDMGTAERQHAYSCDITYGTNNEFGFDYLRDNMRPAARGDNRYPLELQQVQRPLNYAIIDEVDNILIDEARTPLIISGPAHDDVSRYRRADQIARQLRRDVHFVVNEKEHTCNLTEEGVRRAEELAGVESFYTAGNMEWPHLIDNALKAHHLYKRDVHYIVNDQGEVVIVDEFTGRLMPGRNWSDGLHQAVEAKEGVRIKEEYQTLATITLQNFFKLYKKICGMTGTAMTEANEFWKIYKLDVIAIPTNKPLIRINHPDVVYRTEREKFNAIADEIERMHKWDTITLNDWQQLVGSIVKETEDAIQFQEAGTKDLRWIEKRQIRRIERRGRPILVGTVSIEKSERLSRMLTQRGIKHQVLNAKHHQREAEIIAQAGRKGAVTIATNMAGRGTDIILGGNPEAMAWALLQHKYPTRLDVPPEEWDALVREIEAREQTKAEGREVAAMGGLHVIGTERHEARRIDLQLRGRCGRQGDPGSSRFFLSLEDDLMRIFAGEWVKNVLTRLGMQEGEAIESKLVTRRIEGAQKKVEERNFEIRKNLLEYDEVMDQQRKMVYSYRQRILDGADCRALLFEMVGREIDRHVDRFLDKDYGAASFAEWVGRRLSVELDPKDLRGMDFPAAENFAKEEAQRMAESQIFDLIEENFPEDEDPNEWNWEALAKAANIRWKLGVRERDLRKIGRDRLSEVLIEQAHEAIAKADLAGAAPFLEPDFGLKSVAQWVRHKFGLNLELRLDERGEADPAAVKALVRQKVEEAYQMREAEYPVLSAWRYFTSQDAQGRRHYDREGLAAWAYQRFGMEISPAEFRSRSRQEIHDLLLQASLATMERGRRVLREAMERVERAIASREFDPTARAVSANGELRSLAEWLDQAAKVAVPVDELARMDPDTLRNRVRTAIDEQYRPEIRYAERIIVLQVLDEAWKNHLLVMDHLRSSVGLRGYAQVDPKVEFKREGMRTFDEMWNAVAQRATDLMFRIEQMDTGFVGSTWAGAQAIHEEVPAAVSEIAEQQEAAIEGTQTGAKREPYRNRQQRVGRNDPCPCGSGKKFKHCHGRGGNG